MNLTLELDPAGETHYAVITTVRATGSRRVQLITESRSEAMDRARELGGYVLEINRIVDFR